MEAKTNTDLRTSGMMDYFESCKLHLLSWEAFTGESQDITTMENGLVSCKVYEWVEYTWYSDDFPDPVSSGFGTWHTLTLAPNAGDTSYQIVQDIYDESDISGFNNTVSKANDFDNEILPHYDTRGNVSTFSALASSFSRSAAVSYADAYVGNYSFSSGDVADYTYYNKQYKNFNASGGDCANYVSQCLKAAGLGTTSNWYYNNNGSICTDSTHDARVGHMHPLLILIQAQILSVLQMLAFLGEVQHNHTLLFALQLVAILSSSILITTIERELNIMRERLLVTV